MVVLIVISLCVIVLVCLLVLVLLCVGCVDNCVFIMWEIVVLICYVGRLVSDVLFGLLVFCLVIMCCIEILFVV